MDRNIAYHMGSISMISFNGTKSRGNPSPVKGGSVQGTSKGRFLAPSGNSGHLQKSLKGVLDGTRSHMHDRQSQVSDHPIVSQVVELSKERNDGQDRWN